ncbi:MAG: hypothetical protein ACHQNE_05980 [Candidatus Kapaibacterium sp.]
MRNREYNTEETQKLEDEIRKLGIPYASEEPEPFYWANFRVRVMDRIAEKERKANWPARFGQFIAEHVLGAGIAVSAACLLVAAVLWLQPSGGEAPQLAAVQQTPAAVLAPPVPLQAVAEATHAAHEPQRIHVTHQTHAPAQPPDDLASVAVPLGNDDENPVSLQSLTQPELEAVLQNLQSNE